ncbi:MAG TPA: VOC family protein [Actinomycetota bacterium]|jgi:predicted enzyme related to lactoylglutathione lyase|nr:VOC family protein [Actinomycetota bacterium]
MTGRVVHFEIPADDVERAQNFYSKAFGWRIDSMPGMEYTMVQTTPSDETGIPTRAGGINGGMLKRQEPITNPVITIEVPDIEDALKTVEELGGKVALGKTQIEDMGFSAYFTDSEGNTIGLWQPASSTT